MKRYIELFKQTFTEFGQDKAPRLGAALAYYTMFSIGPLLLIAVAMAGIFLGQEAAQGKVAAELRGVFGSQMADGVQKMIQASAKPKAGTVATIVGVITLMFGASGVFGQLKDALNTIWNVEPKESSGITGFVKNRFLSMAMVFGIGFLLLVTLVFDAIISAAGEYFAPFVGGEAVLQAAQLVVSFALVVVLFAALFRYLPDLDIAWRDVWFGAMFTALLFVLGKFALGLYLGKAVVGSSYGAAGSLVIVLIWVYWSAQILFFGAEFTQVYARSHGSLKGDTSKQEARARAHKPEDRPRSVADASGRPATPRPAYTHAKTGGGAGKLALGGVAGLTLGTLVGGTVAALLVMKSLKKLLMSPFR